LSAIPFSGFSAAMMLAREKDVAVGKFIRMMEDPMPLAKNENMHMVSELDGLMVCIGVCTKKETMQCV
jgi:hypothetical protein